MERRTVAAQLCCCVLTRRLFRGIAALSSLDGDIRYGRDCVDPKMPATI